MPTCLHYDANGMYCPPSPRLSICDFQVLEELAAGNFRIFHARHIPSDKDVVLKVVSKAHILQLPQHMQERIRTEIEIHSRMAHPDIIQFLAMFHDEHSVYLVLEYAPHGDLEQLLASQPTRRLDEKRAANITAAVARALRYCHSQGVAHRDVKPGNILLGPDDTACLADFGLAKEFAKPGRPAFANRLHSLVGTPDYIAPEVCAPRRIGYDQRCDLWSLGTLLYEMLVGEPPFYVEDIDETYDRISRADFVFPTGPDAISPDAEELISALLHMDPKRRPTPSQVLMSRWILRHCGPMARGAVAIPRYGR